MKAFKNQAAQGDILIMRVASLPETVTEVAPSNGRLVLSHDAGHPHTVPAGAATLFRDTSNPLRLYVNVTTATAIEHQRAFDTHEPLELQPGLYEVRRQREWTPEGFRAVED